MTPSKSRTNLGRGLDALFGETAEEDVPVTADAPEVKAKGLTLLPIEQLAPSPLQPRHRFDDAQLAELAASIKDKGVLQPLLVRPAGDGAAAPYEIIAGERRWRASQQAKIHQVPVIIKEFNDTEVLEVALVENLQRADLTPLEEAEGYRRLQDEFGHSQERLADLLGKSRAHIANMLRLLGLPDGVKRLLDDGSLSTGHARALIGLADADALAKTIVKKGLSVRQVEKLVKSHGKAARPRKAPAAQDKDADTRALESRLEQVLGLKVEISFDGKGGALTLRYGDLEQLDDLVHRLTVNRPVKAAVSDRDPNVLDLEEVLQRRESGLKPDHSGDAASGEARPDPLAGDVGASGSLDRE